MLLGKLELTAFGQGVRHLNLVAQVVAQARRALGHIDRGLVVDKVSVEPPLKSAARASSRTLPRNLPTASNSTVSTPKHNNMSRPNSRSSSESPSHGPTATLKHNDSSMACTTENAANDEAMTNARRDDSAATSTPSSG